MFRALVPLLVAINIYARPSPLFGFTAPAASATSSAATTPVSNATITADFVRPAEFARIAYCSAAQVTSGQVGNEISGVEVLQAGGDEELVPMYYIAHDPATQSIVLAHQGTNVRHILSIGNDVQLSLAALNNTHFPNADQGVTVHSGFQKTFERTADGVLAGVQSALSSKGVSKLLVTGHSLGAAVATMGAVMLRQNLDPSVDMTTVVFGLPRSGNQAWADLVNANLGTTFTHITNQHDPVPTVPPLLLGYVHPQGEVHITAVDAQGDATSVVACPGQENAHCSEGNSLLDASVSNHAGPYFQNISMNTANCPLS